MRTDWVAKRQHDKIRTQMHYARQGIITEEMQYVAAREQLSAELDQCWLRGQSEPHLHQTNRQLA